MDNTERLYYLLQESKCPMHFLDNKQTLDTAKYLHEIGAVVLPRGGLEQLCTAVNALADMVDQFGYSTTFRRQDAVCDGGLSALENAFYALELCGARVNSNGTINRKNLWNFKMEDIIEGCLEVSE